MYCQPKDMQTKTVELWTWNQKTNTMEWKAAQVGHEKEDRGGRLFFVVSFGWVWKQHGHYKYS
jgi:hypothetical protein